MYMVVSIQHLNINTLYYSSTYIEEEIHKGLVALKGGKLGVRFLWFSLFMHMFLFKGVDYFGQEMEHKRVVDGIEMSVHSWTPILDRNGKNTDYVTTTNIFATKLRQDLIVDVPRIPKELHDFLRPAKRRLNLNIAHNWGDVIPYNNCIV